MKGKGNYYTSRMGRARQRSGLMRRQPNLNLPKGGMIGANPFAPQRAQPFDFGEQMERKEIYRRWQEVTPKRLQARLARNRNWEKNLNRWFQTPSTHRYRYMPEVFTDVAMGRIPVHKL